MGTVAMLLVACTATAELQNISIGGEIRIRARDWHNVYDTTNPNGLSDPRIPAFLLPNRPIGPFGTVSRYGFYDRGNERDYVEQKTTIDIEADFTDNIRAEVLFESYDQWGTGFRSNYLTGADTSDLGTSDVALSQSFIEIEEMWDKPIVVRIGRQAIGLDKRWLLSEYIGGTITMPFDGVRVMYLGDQWEIDGWATKLVETGTAEEDGDVDFYGAHATLKIPLDMSMTAYWYFVRDARKLNDTNGTAFLEWIEDAAGRDDYDPTELHTLGTRIQGDIMSWDFDLEAAYQFGDVDAIGSGFRASDSAYGDDHAKASAWGFDLEAGRTFKSIPLEPRIFIGGAWLSGEDNRNVDFVDWLNPFERPDASVSFSRLFSGYVYSWTLDVGQDLTNFKQVRIGAEASLTDAIVAHLLVSHYWVDEPFESPLFVNAGRFQIPVAPNLSFLSKPGSDDVGTTAFLWFRYTYSENWWISAGAEYLFAGEALEDGSFMHRHGLEFTGGLDDEDAMYFFIDSGIKFGGKRRSVDMHQVEYRTKK